VALAGYWGGLMKHGIIMGGMKKIRRQIVIISSAFVLLFASIPLIPQSSAYAQASNCDAGFYSSNDIIFFNPCAVTCGGTATPNNGTISLRGDNNGEKIFNFWLDAGLSAQQAAGITGSMQGEGGFSPFRQENNKTWPSGGWGIAQFTDDERTKAAAYVKSAVGDASFAQYYKDEFGGPVVESSGFVPKGISSTVNDSFLLPQLNYLLETVKALQPNEIRTKKLQDDFSQIIPTNSTLYSYIETLVQSNDVAIAWTYLYEYPDDIKKTAASRGNSATIVLDLYGQGLDTGCGGTLAAGGLNLEAASAFMETYKNSADSIDYIGGAGRTCSGGTLSNCVSFSVYFINKYTTLSGFGNGTTPGNGSTVAANAISRNPNTKNGTSPQPYALFSVASGSMMCGNVKCGHTGVILGVDTVAGTVIVGEAVCGGSSSSTKAKEYPLSQFDNGTYTYIYAGDSLKDGIR
jgi:hypothetical protein